MNKIDISKPRESGENTVSHVSNINGTRKDIDAVLSDNRIILPKERYSSIDYIMTFPEGAKKKIFSSHIKFSSAAIQKMKADPFMKYEEKGENLLFLGDEVELNGFLYPPIEYEIQKDELSYIIYDDKRIFDKIQISIDANVFTVETEEENK